MFALGLGSATLTALGELRGTVHEEVGAEPLVLAPGCRPVPVTEVWFDDIEGDGVPDLVVRVGTGPGTVLERSAGGRFVPPGC